MSLSSRALAAVFATLEQEAKASSVANALDEIGGEVDDFSVLARRYRSAREYNYECGRNEVLLTSWFVARLGPSLDLSAAEFEASVESAAGGRLPHPLVSPKWVLGEPVEGALQRRLPCRPLVHGDDEDLFRAYGGLLDHLAHLRTLRASDRALEILNTAIPWRIVALADRLQPEESEKDGITYRLGRLRSRTVDDGRTSAVERSWWDALDRRLIARRHVLSHLGEHDGLTFSRCVEDMWPLETALEATAGIALSVMAKIAGDLKESPPTAAFQAVLEETAWLDAHADEGGRDG